MNFRDFIGNEKIVLRLSKTSERNRFPHACLFHGKEGVGKRSLAMILAKSFNCLEPDGCVPCDLCANCRKIDRAVHPDVTVIAPDPDKNNILIEQTRELIRQMSFKPFEGKKRVFIIDDAERMSRESTNSLLKTLEEPPENACLFLITSNIGKILPTIQSRCQQHRFVGIPSSAIENYLMENNDYSQEDAHRAALLAEGSLGNAIKANLQEFTENRGKLIKILETLIIINKKDSFVQCAENLPSERKELKSAFEKIQCLFRDIVVVITGSSKALMVNRDIHGKLLQFSEYFRLEDITEISDEISGVVEVLEKNINPNTKGLTESIFLLIQKKTNKNNTGSV